MTMIDLKGGTSKLNTVVIIRKCVIALFSLAATVCGFLGCFYFHLLLNSAMKSLIAIGSCMVTVILLCVSKLLARKDTYKCLIACLQQYSKGKLTDEECITVVDRFMSPSDKGYSSFRAAVSENKRLLRAMLTNCTAFEVYADRGILTLLCGILLRFVYKPFVYFALLDGILNGGKVNKQYRILASTRWYRVRDRYSLSLIGWLLKGIAPLIVGMIMSAIISTVLNSLLGITSSMELLINVGVLSLILQLNSLTGKRALIHRMSLDIFNKGEGSIPAADYNLCLAFAKLSDYYYNACLEAGFIQTTSSTPATSVEALQGGSGQLLN